jgi:hypothetical protein
MTERRNLSSGFIDPFGGAIDARHKELRPVTKKPGNRPGQLLLLQCQLLGRRSYPLYRSDCEVGM